MRTVFLLCILIGAVCGQTFDLPNGHTLHELVDKYFALTDRNHDGVITYDEVSFYPALEDANNDGFVTLAEYMNFTKSPIEVAQPIFNAYDTDHDGKLPVNMMEAYFHLLDPNGDGQSTKHEYEHYSVTFLQCVFGHHTGGHGHGSDCSQRR